MVVALDTSTALLPAQGSAVAGHRLSRSTFVRIQSATASLFVFVIALAQTVTALALSEPEVSPSPTTASRAWVVAQDDSGDFATIGEAVDAAAPGDTVLVRPGTYEESVTVGRAVTIAGEDPELVVVRAPLDSAPCGPLHQSPCAMLIVDSDATVRGLTLVGSDETMNNAVAVNVSGGSPRLEGLSIVGDILIADASRAFLTSSDVAGTVLVSDAMPTVQGNRIALLRSEQGGAPRIRRNSIARLELVGSGGTVRGNSIVGAGSKTSGRDGVGILVRRPMKGLSIRENRIARHRVGLSVADGTSLAILFNNFERNRVAVLMDEVGDAAIRGNIFCQTRQDTFRTRRGLEPSDLMEICGSGG